MIYLIKLFFFLIISYSSFANENEKSEILFKINNKVFTNIDLEERKEYVGLINNFIPSKFSESENIEILNDYISALIFYEYYIQNKIFFKNLNLEINSIYQKNIKDSEELNDEKIKKIKFNTNIDLIRNKIIQERLNLKKNSLLQEVNKIDLLYNYNLQNIIIKENLIDNELIKNINNREKFDNFKSLLIKNKIDFFYKEQDIDDNALISNKIRNIINQNLEIYINKESQYINIISIKKN